MANNNYDIVQVRRGTEEQWLTADPILKVAEEAYVTDKLLSKHGDGIHKFSELPYDNAADGIYTTDIPIPVDIGGFKAGETPTNVTYFDMWDILIHPYVKPTVTLSASPGTSTREYTNDITSVSLTATVTQKSRNIDKVDFLLNGSVIGTVTTPSSTSTDEETKYQNKVYKLTYSTLLSTEDIGSLTTNGSASVRSITARVTDSEGTVTSSAINYTFVAPMYVGSVAGTVSSMNSASIRALTKKVQNKANISYSYTITDSKFVFAYPACHGNLSSVLDTNGFEILPDFTKSTVNIVQYDGSTTVPYNVYLFNNVVSLDNFTVTYKF